MVVEELISCFLSLILLELIILTKISKLRIIHITIVFALFYSYSNGIDFDDHGLYNIKYYFILLNKFLSFFVL